MALPFPFVGKEAKDDQRRSPFGISPVENAVSSDHEICCTYTWVKYP